MMGETLDDMRFRQGYFRAEEVIQGRPDGFPLADYLAHPRNRPLRSEAEAVHEGYNKRCREELEAANLPVPEWAKEAPVPTWMAGP